MTQILNHQQDRLDVVQKRAGHELRRQERLLKAILFAQEYIEKGRRR